MHCKSIILCVPAILYQVSISICGHTMVYGDFPGVKLQLVMFFPTSFSGDFSPCPYQIENNIGLCEFSIVIVESKYHYPEQSLDESIPQNTHYPPTV